MSYFAYHLWSVWSPVQHHSCIKKCLSEHSVVFVFLQDESLWNASWRGHVEKLQELVKRGANVNWTNPYYVSPILLIIQVDRDSYYNNVTTSCIESKLGMTAN